MILFLVKVCDKKDYAAAFLEGNLFAQRLCCFKQMEAEVDDHGDEYEGEIMPAVEGLSFEFRATNAETGETEVFAGTGDDLHSPPVLLLEWFDHVDVFCLYAGHTGDIQFIPADNWNSRRTVWN